MTRERARERTRGIIISCLVVALGHAGAALAQPPVDEPAPRDLISRGRIRMPEFGVSLAAPSSEWEWRRIRTGTDTIYLCQHPSSKTYYAISAAPTPVIGEGYIRGFLRALDDPSITGLKFEASTVPVAGSYRVTYEQRHRSGVNFHVTTYTIPRTPVSVSLSHSSLDAGESPAFTAFVKGYRPGVVQR